MHSALFSQHALCTSFLTFPSIVLWQGWQTKRISQLESELLRAQCTIEQQKCTIESLRAKTTELTDALQVASEDIMSNFQSGDILKQMAHAKALEQHPEWKGLIGVSYSEPQRRDLRLLNRNQWCQIRPRSTTPGLKKSGKTSLCCKLLPNSARHIGFSISHRGPKIHNPRTQVLYVVPQPTQPTVVPDTHALVGVVPSTTSQRNTNPERAARHMHGLSSFTAPSDGEAEVLVQPPRSTPKCRTWYLRGAPGRSCRDTSTPWTCR